MLVALCPGFGTVAVMLTLELLRRRHSMLALNAFQSTPGGYSAVTIIVWLVLAVGAGWFDAMLDPSFPKIEGELNKRALIRFLLVYVGCQPAIVMLVVAVSAVIAEVISH
ncbi:MAG: hypothetical protein ABIT37_18685 [Luteolibacter sp.]